MITARANEALSYAGLIQGTDTSITTVSGTQAYNFPTNFVEIHEVRWKGYRLKKLTFRQWTLYRNETTTVSGRPTSFVLWNNQILLVPIPDSTGDQITVYGHKLHPEIDGTTQTTIDLAAQLHPFLAHGVIADMFAKDVNSPFFTAYENKWITQSIPAFRRYRENNLGGGQFSVIGDSDTDVDTSEGIV